MIMDEQRAWILMTRVLSNEASIAEQQKLEAWLNEEPERKKHFEELKVSWNENPGNIPTVFDGRKGLNLLRNKIEEEAGKKVVPISRYQRKSTFKSWQVAASIVFLVSLLSTAIVVSTWKPDNLTYSTSAVEQRIINLPDGSTVQLNANSTVSFLENFEGDERKIILEGEAFFDVEKKPQKPFIIYTDLSVVKVLGTSFMVKEQKNSEGVLVAVREGVVSFRHKDEAEENATNLRKGSLGYFATGNNEVHIEEVDIENYLSWIHGHLSFESTPFSDVLTQLERIYGIENIMRDSSLASQQLTAYTSSSSLDEILRMISLSLDISYVKTGDTIVWSTKKAKAKPPAQ